MENKARGEESLGLVTEEETKFECERQRKCSSIAFPLKWSSRVTVGCLGKKKVVYVSTSYDLVPREMKDGIFNHDNCQLDQFIELHVKH